MDLQAIVCIYKTLRIFSIQTRLVRETLNPFKRPTLAGEKKNNMARPPKTPAQPFEISLPIRLTKSQHEALKLKAEQEGLNVSDFVRGKLLNAKPRQQRALPHEVEAVRALGTLGNIRADINQILKDRFSHVFVHPDRMAKSLKDIESIATHLHEILKKYGH